MQHQLTYSSPQSRQCLRALGVNIRNQSDVHDTLSALFGLFPRLKQLFVVSSVAVHTHDGGSHAINSNGDPAFPLLSERPRRVECMRGTFDRETVTRYCMEEIRVLSEPLVRFESYERATKHGKHLDFTLYVVRFWPHCFDSHVCVPGLPMQQHHTKSAW